MNTSSRSEFLLLVRGTSWDHTLSPAELQNAMSGFLGWFERLSAEGTLLSGQPLQEKGHVLSGKQGRIVADGPFAESKEAVGGYFLIQADSFNEAIEIARQCPMLEYNMTLEVRPIAAVCPSFARANMSSEALEVQKN